MEGYVKKELVKELKNVSKRMLDEPELVKKLFYYSAAYGAVDRTMRYGFTKQLLMAHTILNVTYNAYKERLRAIAGGDSVVPLTIGQLDRTAELVRDLGDAFNKGIDVNGILADIMLLAYMSTGPGHYLNENGAFEGLI